MLGEIEIGDKWIGSSPVWMRHKDGSWELTGDMLPAAEVLRQIEAHRQAGARVLLVTFGWCGGGSVAESLEIVAGLRRFSAEVGPVVAHVSGIIGSTGPLLAIAADFVLMAPKARMLFHCATLGKEPNPEATRELVPHFSARCAASEAEVHRWLSHGLPGSPEPVIIADPDAATFYGLADAVGTLDQARALASMVAAGMPLPQTPRSAFLLQGPAVPSASPELLAATGVLMTSDFALDANGYPSAGARLINTGMGQWTWSSATTYGLGAAVGYPAGGTAYRSLQASNTNHQPDTSPTWWEAVPPLQVAPSGIQIGAHSFTGRFRHTQLTMAGTATTMTWTFSENEPDTNYAIVATAYNDAYTVPNPPAPMGAFVIAHVAKNVGSAVITAFTAPGAGATVYWDVARFRLN